MAEASPVEPATRILDLSELKKHTTETDCYLLYDGKVYDVTEFLDEHPGGAMALASGCQRTAVRLAELQTLDAA